MVGLPRAAHSNSSGSTILPIPLYPTATTAITTTTLLHLLSCIILSIYLGRDRATVFREWPAFMVNIYAILHNAKLGLLSFYITNMFIFLELISNCLSICRSVC
ncbi:hypothetical protein F4777DRAFT_182169 [Nemania sp. FL0916]|nr:hypothetical protein F4777DRAFT_182169 [Nemania sp. FL0916]